MNTKKLLFYFSSMLISFSTIAQNLVVSDDSTYLGTSNNALFEVYSANSNKGILIPRLTTTQRISIATTGVDEGLVVYDTDTHSFWVWDGTQWTELGDKQTLSISGNTLSILNGNSVNLTSSINSTAWGLTGNSGTNENTNFIGTTDDVPLTFKINNTLSGKISTNNTFLGYLAGSNISSGNGLTLYGKEAGYDLTTGTDNVLLGNRAGYYMQSGDDNTAIGTNALYNYNYAGSGPQTGGNGNVAIGKYSMFNPVGGDYNVGVGYMALSMLNSGSENTYIGAFADIEGTTPSTDYCTVLGSRAKISDGVTNSTVIGYRAYTDTSNTIVLGSIAGINGATSTARVGIGTTKPQVRLEVKGEPNTEIFRISNDGTTYPLQVFLGNDIANVQNNDGVVYFEVIGNETYVFGGHVVPDGDASRHLGTSGHRWQDVWATNGTIQTSDINDKTNIKPMSYGLKEVLKLNPIAFRWKNDELNYNDFKIGFSAQELQKVIPEVVVKDKEHPNTSLGVMYSDIIPVLVNAIKQQQTQIEQLKKQNNEILKRLSNLENK